MAKQPTLVVKGTVFHGRGEGAKFMMLPWVKQQVTEKLGFAPFPGTLNVKLIQDEVYSDFLKKATSIPIVSTGGLNRGKCFNAYLVLNLKCAIVIPEIPNYPNDVIEIIAPINLREKCQLQDGALVEVKISR